MKESLCRSTAFLANDNSTPAEQILALAMKARRKGETTPPRFGSWHIDSEVERTIIRLNDEVCSFERSTGREYTILLIPHDSLEQVMMSQNGKPLPPDFDMEPEEILSIAMSQRRGG
ncbi:MAG: hypothetical protein PHC97_00070 [Patescibacteria group bacterium]|nr:hypothetical protein [Patescibacteria group bacterium]